MDELEFARILGIWCDDVKAGRLPRHLPEADRLEPQEVLELVDLLRFWRLIFIPEAARPSREELEGWIAARWPWVGR